ncbi:signal transducing adapter molecule 1 isoform X2 [Danaus plexippus]|uniref:signal transducing adapter molecule 1 isoform X2 n=1 Tax=Danaus plexippus TaxID=13037 RepID=UPI002AB2B9A8|nr:signal transducing adapter molecule 1 isoform X2 [Danaus plexippus]
MGIFGTSSPFDQDVERATSENNTSEEWGLILEICDRAGSGPAAARDCLRAVLRRLGHADPHVQVHAATLLDACVANCGRVFHLEVASRDFEAEFRRLLSRAQPPVAGRLRALLRKWAEGEFRDDPQLDLIPSLHVKLSAESGERVSSAAAPAADAQTVLTAAERREQEELARAIALSLRDSSGSGGAAGAGAGAAGGSLYPRVEAETVPTPVAMKVRALYDFEAAEDNELTFLAGEIVHVTDSSDPNWWKGHNERGEGLFPANFVTSDLTEPAPESENRSNSGKTVQFAESAGGAEQPARIDEAVVDEALALLHEADPAADDATGPRLARAEAAAHAMGALVDAALERADRRHARLTQLSADLVDALNLYHDLMRAPPTFLPPMHYAPGPAAATLPPPPPGALLPGPLPSLAPHHPQPPRC